MDVRRATITASRSSRKRNPRVIFGLTASLGQPAIPHHEDAKDTKKARGTYCSCVSSPSASETCRCSKPRKSGVLGIIEHRNRREWHTRILPDTLVKWGLRTAMAGGNAVHLCGPGWNRRAIAVTDTTRPRLTAVAGRLASAQPPSRRPAGLETTRLVCGPGYDVAASRRTRPRGYPRRPALRLT